jgi:hypothetical protein
MTRSLLHAFAVAVAAVLAAGCASATTTSRPSSGSGSGASPGASSTASPSFNSTPAAPTAPTALGTPMPTGGPEPAPESTPLPTPAAGWSAARQIRAGECQGLSATIDATSRYHVASVCDGGIRYLTSKGGVDWIETSFSPPIDRLELGPQLAVDGDTVHLAYTRIAAEEGGCGDNGLRDLGVYLRTRHLPDGTWSEPVRIGSEGDGVQAFRAVDEVLHLTVTSANGGPVFYESQAGSTFTRIGLPNAVTTTLRVGDDGHARIAYATGHAIRYARVDGSVFSSATVAETDETFLTSPLLVLGPGDDAYLMWTQTTDNGGGCASPEEGPLDGTYFGTDESGRWAGRRISTRVAQTSLTLDPSTGRLHAIVGAATMTYFTMIGNGSWTSTELPDTNGLLNPVIRLDPTTGKVVVFALHWEDGIWILRKS